MSMVFCRGCAKQIHESAVSCPGCGATQNGGASGVSTGAASASTITFGNVFFEVMKKYATFQGRARRKEYWLFAVVINLISLLVGFVDGFLGLTPIFSLLFSLAVMIPAIALAVRRLHDTDHSGWWILVPIVNIVFMFFDSTPGNNRFGPNPKGQ
ncbi:DUF805 domain-containing protein [Pseudomonas sp. NPDC089406]|uniref:DUF805 domain-containing protein n=1 Tax=Pseudomonas sp. NPDC089406 TaxID=3364463 RepID=UPI00384F6EF9